MSVLGLAGLLKLTDVVAFATHVKSWAFVPRPVVIPLAVAVPTIEWALAIAWFLRISKRATVVIALVLLVGFSLAYAMHALLFEAPSCGCFGAQVTLLTGMIPAEMEIVFRNMLLASFIAVGSHLGKAELAATGE